MALTEAELELNFPWIEWRVPVPIYRTAALGEKPRLGCRYCIAQKGLNGVDVPKLPATEEEFRQHMQECHGKAVVH